MSDAELTFWEDAQGRIITDSEGAPVLCDSCPPLPAEPETGWWLLVSCDGSTYNLVDESIRNRLISGYGTFTSPYPAEGTVSISGTDYALGTDIDVPTDEYGTLTGSLHIVTGPYPDEEAADAASGDVSLSSLFERVAMQCNPACGFATPIYARVIAEFEYNATNSDGSTDRETGTYDRIQTWDFERFSYGRWVTPQLTSSGYLSDGTTVDAFFSIGQQYPMHFQAWRTDSNGSTVYGEGDLQEGIAADICAIGECSYFRFQGGGIACPAPDGNGGISWPAYSPPSTRSTLWGNNNAPLNDLFVDETIVDEFSPDYITHRTQTITDSSQDDSVRPFPTIDISFAWSESFTYPGGGNSASVSGRFAVIPILEADFNTLDEYEYARQQLAEELQ